MHVLAAELRQRGTKSEAQLWQALRNRRLDGRKFRRQVPIGAYVVDFYCPEERLVIEVDGSVHVGQEAADQLRQELMEALGLRFLRFGAGEIEGDLEAVLRKIRMMFDK